MGWCRAASGRTGFVRVASNRDGIVGASGRVEQIDEANAGPFMPDDTGPAGTGRTRRLQHSRRFIISAADHLSDNVADLVPAEIEAPVEIFQRVGSQHAEMRVVQWCD
jgi:hypothetical protein